MNMEHIVVKEDLGVCRCCLTEGNFRNLNEEYVWMGETEVYAEMLQQCFNIRISYHPSYNGINGAEQLICEDCIARLREACQFRRQVIDAETKMSNMLGLSQTEEVSDEVKMELTECTESGDTPEACGGADDTSEVEMKLDCNSDIDIEEHGVTPRDNPEHNHAFEEPVASSSGKRSKRETAARKRAKNEAEDVKHSKPTVNEDIEDSVESRIEASSRKRSRADREQSQLSLRPRSIPPPNASLESSMNNSNNITNEKNRDETCIPSTDDDENSSLSLNRPSDFNESVNDFNNAHLSNGNVSLPSRTGVTETPQHTLLAESIATCTPPVAINVTVEDRDVNESLSSILRQEIVSPDAFYPPANINTSGTDASFIEDSGAMQSSHAYNVCNIRPGDDSNLTVKDQVRPCSINGVPNGTDSSGVENSQTLQFRTTGNADLESSGGSASECYDSDRDATFNPEFEMSSSSSSDEEMTKDMEHAEFRNLKACQLKLLFYS